MAVQYAPMKLRVPAGFQNLLEGLAREVLREQPDDIILFAAQYFRNQLLIREESGKDDAKKGEKMEKLMKGEEVDIDLNDPEVQAAATKIQASFRGHKAREDVKKQKEEEQAAIKIQASFRGHQTREKVKEIKASQSKEHVASSAEESASVVETNEAAPEAQTAEAGEEAQPREAEVKPEEEEPGSKILEAGTTVEEADNADNQAAEEPAANNVPLDLTATAGAADSVEEPKQEEPVTETEGEAAEEIKQGASNTAPDAQPTEAEAGETQEAPVIAGEADQVEPAVGEGAGNKAEDEIDIDPNDPEVQGAVLKIQASFRGHKVREELKAMKSSEAVAVAQGDEQASEEKAADDKEETLEVKEEDGGNEAVQESEAAPPGNEALDDKITDEKQDSPEGTEESKGDDANEPKG